MGLNKESENNIKIISLILITLFILYILHVQFGSYFGVEIEGEYDSMDLTLIFEKNLNDKTLTVVEIYPENRDFFWPEISVASGSATLPFDIIDIGDIITDCEGYVKLIYEQTGATICEEDFNQ